MVSRRVPGAAVPRRPTSFLSAFASSDTTRKVVRWSGVSGDSRATPRLYSSAAAVPGPAASAPAGPRRGPAGEGGELALLDLAQPLQRARHRSQPAHRV